MKILMVSSLKRSVTPVQTASRTRIVYELAKGLISRGHTVTLLGTKDSELPGAKIVGVIPSSFTSLPVFENPFYAETSYLVQLAKAIEELASEYDVIHNHTYPEFINLLVAERLKTPMITTLHAQATKEFDMVLSRFPSAHLVSISQAHKRLFTHAIIEQVIYNGIDTSLYSYKEKKDDYLLWIGRLGKARNADGSFMDAKGVGWAISLARVTGQKLKLTGNVEDRDFFDKAVAPFLSEQIQWVGDVSSEQPLDKESVVALMQNAKAFLMTINWEEPFGLVMAEAMSCGTPIIGFDRGSVREIVQDNTTGFVVSPHDGVPGLQKAVEAISQIDTFACRKHVEKYFSIEKMVSEYEIAYERLVHSTS